MRNRFRCSRRFGKELRSRCIVHRDVPPSGRFDRRSNRQQTVVLQNDGLLRSQRFGDLSPLLPLQHDAGERIKQRVVFIEGAGVLGQRIEQTAERRPGLAIGRVRMGRGDHLRMRGMDRQ
jgi:hypothetical protein